MLLITIKISNYYIQTHMEVKIVTKYVDTKLDFLPVNSI